MQIKYNVIRGTNLANLIDNVNEAISNGYDLLGGLSFDGSFYLQSVYKVKQYQEFTEDEKDNF